MKRISLTLLEWQLALAAWAYEVEDDPIMSDQSFDTMALTLDPEETIIPGYSPDTGLWIYDLNYKVGDVYEKVRYFHPKGDIHHPAIIAALEDLEITYIKQPWQLEDEKNGEDVTDYLKDKR